MQGERAAINAIVSVSDPAHLDVLGAALARLGASVYATGGTQARLAAAASAGAAAFALPPPRTLRGSRAAPAAPRPG